MRAEAWAPYAAPIPSVLPVCECVINRRAGRYGVCGTALLGGYAGAVLEDFGSGLVAGVDDAGTLAEAQSAPPNRPSWPSTRLSKSRSMKGNMASATGLSCRSI